MDLDSGCTTAGPVRLSDVEGPDLHQTTSYCTRTFPGCVRTTSGCSGLFGGLRNSPVPVPVLPAFRDFPALCRAGKGLLRNFEAWGVFGASVRISRTPRGSSGGLWPAGKGLKGGIFPVLYRTLVPRAWKGPKAFLNVRTGLGAKQRRVPNDSGPAEPFRSPGRFGSGSGKPPIPQLANSGTERDCEAPKPSLTFHRGEICAKPRRLPLRPPEDPPRLREDPGNRRKKPKLAVF